jgi:hypothetical protein
LSTLLSATAAALFPLPSDPLLVSSETASPLVLVTLRSTAVEPTV